MIRDVVVLVLLGLGIFFVASAALGMLRFPDVFSRMHAITKAGTLGVGLCVTSAAVYFGTDLSLVVRAVAIIAFTLLTAPVSAQMIGRAAYLAGAPRAPETHIDRIAEHYEDPGELFRAGPDGTTERP